MKTALYSTFYPAMMPYLDAFWQSLKAQTDQAFDRYFGLDGVKQKDIERVAGNIAATWVEAENDSVASIRERILLDICNHYDAVILVDSDDVLLPHRVSSAKKNLETRDVYACALDLINEQGEALNATFTTGQQNWASFLAKVNVFGFSNTAYRCNVLKCCFPIPRETVMVDWLVVSKALASGATLFFDETSHMLYRQYETNTARVLSPYTPAQIAKATSLVLQHYDYVLSNLPMSSKKGLQPLVDVQTDTQSRFRTNVCQRKKAVEQFAQATQSLTVLKTYTKALNKLKPVFMWWECVAHPDLETLWK